MRESNDLIHWIKFFLNAVIETAEKGKRTFKEILALKNRIDAQIVTLNRRAESGRQLMQILYRKPVVTVNEVAGLLDITRKSANVLIGELVTLGILEEITGQRRNRVFGFTAYVKLFDNN